MQLASSVWSVASIYLHAVCSSMKRPSLQDRNSHLVTSDNTHIFTSHEFLLAQKIWQHNAMRKVDEHQMKMVICCCCWNSLSNWCLVQYFSAQAHWCTSCWAHCVKYLGDFTITITLTLSGGWWGKCKKKTISRRRKERRVEKKACAACPREPGLESGTYCVLGECPQLHAMGVV